MSTSSSTSGSTELKLPRLCLVPVGPPLVHCRTHDRLRPPSAPSPTRVGFNRPDIWRYPVLLYEHVRPLLQRSQLLSPGEILLLGVLLFHELHLDSHSWRYVSALRFRSMMGGTAFATTDKNSAFIQ